jgi:class 3 adenylate cyclase
MGKEQKPSDKTKLPDYLNEILNKPIISPEFNWAKTYCLPTDHFTRAKADKSWEDLLSQPIRYPYDMDSLLGTPSAKEKQLTEEIDRLKTEVKEKHSEIQSAKIEKAQLESNCSLLSEKMQELQTKQQLRFVLDRIETDARDLLLQSQSFQDKFLKANTCGAYVVSVDIRRSTELMLKARKPEDYAYFISELSDGLRQIILKNHGVYDKFTGDGVLAFFPDFYSGADAGYYALTAAYQGHLFFREFYHRNRKCFTAVLKDVGLGIGIDFGVTHLVRLGDGLTVVGTPVVYACRLSGAPLGCTLLNQAAYEQVTANYQELCDVKETDIDIKHEGIHIAYSASLNDQPYNPKSPGWHVFLEAETRPQPQNKSAKKQQ